jgi:hypothetical protein
MFSGLMARPQDYRPEQAKAVGIERMREAAQMLIGAGPGCALKYDKVEKSVLQGGPRKLSHKQVVKLLKVWGSLAGNRSLSFRSIGFNAPAT